MVAVAGVVPAEPHHVRPPHRRGGRQPRGVPAGGHQGQAAHPVPVRALRPDGGHRRRHDPRPAPPPAPPRTACSTSWTPSPRSSSAARCWSAAAAPSPAPSWASSSSRRSPTSSSSTTSTSRSRRSPRARSSSSPCCSSSASRERVSRRHLTTCRTDLRPRPLTAPPPAPHPPIKEDQTCPQLRAVSRLAARRHRRLRGARRRRLHQQHPRGRGDRQPRPRHGLTENDEPGDEVVIGFSAPPPTTAGWAPSPARQRRGREVRGRRAPVAEGTNDVNVQISQIEGFIDQGVDAIVLLPFDGAALTEVALEAMEAGIPVINVDREFASPFAARATVLGDNYGMGVSAGTYICEQLGDNPDADGRRDRRHRLAAADAGPQRGLRGRPRGLRARRRATASRPSSPSSPARSRRRTCCRPSRRSTPSGTTTTTRASASWPPSRTPAGTSSSWSAAPAPKNVDGGHQGRDSVVKATVIYPSTQAADGIKLARLLAQNKTVSDLVESGSPAPSSSTRPSSRRTTSRSTCPSASSPDAVPHRHRARAGSASAGSRPGRTAAEEEP